MIVYPEEDITTPDRPIMYRCPPPCEERHFTLGAFLSCVQEGHRYVLDFYKEFADEV